MALRARALYDFNSENPGEVSVRENEILTLYSEQDIDGWFEGANSKGERGLFPASYVEILRNGAASTLNNNSCSTSGDTYPDSRYANIPSGGFDGSYKPPAKVENFSKPTSPGFTAFPQHNSSSSSSRRTSSPAKGAMMTGMMTGMTALLSQMSQAL
ncbi:Sorting nexin-18 Sorting nexin-associated Golgi protein 1 [Larimichthys crocea]|uniref:Sorting nexin-18 Sorting nexin-associated Golgi protein 1 n=1 Tax=Larimichthys crocea TaxID=215358 RepID=A0A6G0IKY1_LARCR|nr:Sorting nexin-18 Sorting nexin-associated Golgi protein 1 [Larimichthys crocea]